MTRESVAEQKKKPHSRPSTHNRPPPLRWGARRSLQSLEYEVQWVFVATLGVTEVLWAVCTLTRSVGLKMDEPIAPASVPANTFFHIGRSFGLSLFEVNIALMGCNRGRRISRR